MRRPQSHATRPSCSHERSLRPCLTPPSAPRRRGLVMKAALRDMNPFVRGLLIVGVVALVVVILQLQATLTALFLLAQIAFFLAIAFFIYLVWRERRSDIDSWSPRAKVAFYGAAALIVVDLGAFFLSRPSGRD